MQFLKSLFKFDADATTSQKVFTVLPIFIAAFVFIWLFGSCFQVFHNNDIARAAATATGGQHLLGGVFLILAAFWAWVNWTDRVPFRINEAAATILLCLLL